MKLWHARREQRHPELTQEPCKERRISQAHRDKDQVCRTHVSQELARADAAAINDILTMHQHQHVHVQKKVNPILKDELQQTAYLQFS